MLLIIPYSHYHRVGSPPTSYIPMMTANVLAFLLVLTVSGRGGHPKSLLQSIFPKSCYTKASKSTYNSIMLNHTLPWKSSSFHEEHKQEDRECFNFVSSHSPFRTAPEPNPSRLPANPELSTNFHFSIHCFNPYQSPKTLITPPSKKTMVHIYIYRFPCPFPLDQK